MEPELNKNLDAYPIINRPYLNEKYYLRTDWTHIVYSKYTYTKLHDTSGNKQ